MEIIISGSLSDYPVAVGAMIRNALKAQGFEVTTEHLNHFQVRFSVKPGTADVIGLVKLVGEVREDKFARIPELLKHESERLYANALYGEKMPNPEEKFLAYQRQRLESSLSGACISGMTEAHKVAAEYKEAELEAHKAAMQKQFSELQSKEPKLNGGW